MYYDLINRQRWKILGNLYQAQENPPLERVLDNKYHGSAKIMYKKHRYNKR